MCGAIAVWSGLRMVGGFYGVLLLSAKHSRSCLMGKHHVKGGSECPFTDQQYRLEQWSNITLFLRKTNLDCISLEQVFCQVNFSVMHYTRAESGKETSWSQTWQNWERWTFTVTDGGCKHYTSNTAKSYVKWLRRKQRVRWKLWEQVCDELQHHHKQQLERRVQQAAHNAQQVHQWQCWLRWLRGAHHALSLYTAHTVSHLMMTPHTSWLKFWAITLSSPYHPWRTLLDSTSPLFLYFSFLPFSVYFLYSELFLELDNPIVMASLRDSAAYESEDTLNSSHSYTGYEPKLLTFGELNDSSVPFSFMIPSSDQTWMTWHSARCSHRHTEDKSISSSVMFDGSGQPDGERKVDQSVNFGVTRNTYSAHSKFSENNPNWENGRWIRETWWAKQLERTD